MQSCTLLVFIFTAAALVQNVYTYGHGPGYDPCEEYNPVKPSFKVPGRRISEEACEDYVWYVKTDIEKSHRGFECLKKKYGKNLPPFIVGGRATFSGQFPHMGALGWESVDSGYIFKCGGSLISSKFVLTAAHCSSIRVDQYIVDPSPKVVRLNDKNYLHTNPDDEYGIFAVDMNILRIINHPKYKSPKKYYDIALIELETDVYYTKHMQPACLWTNKDHNELGKAATVTGWGVLKHHGTETSPELQVADVDIIDQEQCEHLLSKSTSRQFQGVIENQFCAGKLSGGVDACQGDSGGPIQTIKFEKEYRFVYNIIGVTSFGIGCAFENLPGIYTRVSSFIDWIEPIVWSNATK